MIDIVVVAFETALVVVAFFMKETQKKLPTISEEN